MNMDLDHHFTKQYQGELKKIKAHFKEIVEVDVYACIYGSRSERACFRNADHLALFYEGITIMFPKIKWHTAHEYRSGKVQADLLQESIACELQLQRIQCKVDYISQHFRAGTCTFSIEKIRVCCKVGFWNVADSFVPTNYDFDFYIDGTLIDIDLQPLNETGAALSMDIKEGITRRLWYNAKSFIMHRFMRMIGAILVEHSFKELFQDEPTPFKVYEIARKDISNQKFDAMLKTVLKTAIAHYEQPMQGLFYVGNEVYSIKAVCHIRDLTTIRRLTDASLYVDEDEDLFAIVAIGLCVVLLEDCVIAPLHDNSEPIKGRLTMIPDRHRFSFRFNTPTPGDGQTSLLVEMLELDFQFASDGEDDIEVSIFTPYYDNLLPLLRSLTHSIVMKLLSTMAKEFNERETVTEP